MAFARYLDGCTASAQVWPALTGWARSAPFAWILPWNTDRAHQPWVGAVSTVSVVVIDGCLVPLA
jgi:hypothetical protein